MFFGIYEILFTDALNIQWTLHNFFCMNGVFITEIELFTLL